MRKREQLELQVGLLHCFAHRKTASQQFSSGPARLETSIRCAGERTTGQPWLSVWSLVKVEGGEIHLAFARDKMKFRALSKGNHEGCEVREKSEECVCR